jgi:hypothetical protein
MPGEQNELDAHPRLTPRAGGASSTRTIPGPGGGGEHSFPPTCAPSARTIPDADWGGELFARYGGKTLTTPRLGGASSSGGGRGSPR